MVWRSDMFKGPWPKWPQIHDEERLSERIRRIGATGLWTLRADPAKSLARDAEHRIAQMTGCRHAVLVSSGTTAVELAALAVGAGPGRDIIVPALGWHATASAVRRTGARVIFADVDLQTSCIDPASVARAMTPDTIAIIAVHLHCSVADLDALASLVRRNDLVLIEDAAQAHGAEFRGRPVGGHGQLGCFSFNQEKLVACGEGGAVVTDDADLYERLYALRTDGYREDKGGRLVPNRLVGGHNAALSDFQAAVLLDQLEAFAERHRLRGETVRRLVADVSGIAGVSVLDTTTGTTERGYFEFGLVFHPDVLRERPLDTIAREVTDATGVQVHRTDKPVMQSPLYDPTAAGSAPVPPNASRLYDTMLVFHHRYLLEPRLAETLPEAIATTLRASASASAAS